MGKVFSWKYFHWLFLAILALILLVMELPAINQPMVSEGDAYSRALIAKKMDDDGRWLQLDTNNVWLPLHFTLINIPHWFGVEIFYGQRLATVIISILSVVLIYFYTQEHLKNKTVSILASLLLAALPLRVILGSQTLSESVFLPFFILALYLLVKSKKTILDQILFQLVFIISGLIRFEAWFFIPPIIAYLVFSKIESVKTKISFGLTALLLPISWLVYNFISRGNSFSFFNEKYDMAQVSQIPSYYHWQLSLSEWENQLRKVFPTVFSLIYASQLPSLFNKITLKKAFFFLTPIYLFLILVAQVYFGTMEWFPIRYLLIPIPFALPIVALAIYKIGIFIKDFFAKNQPIWAKILLVSMTALLLFITKESYHSANEITEKHLTTLAFLSLQEISHLSLERYQKIDSFKKLKNEIAFRYPQKTFVEYYYSVNHRSWQDQALFYMLNTQGIDLPKNDFSSFHNQGNVVVWEREPGDEPNWIKNLKILYANPHYYLVDFQ